MATGPTVSAITLGVRDVAVSRAFYVEALGFRLVLDLPGDICFIQCAPGQLLALWEVTQMRAEYGAVGHGAMAPPMSLGHNVAEADEVERLYAAALASGATSVSAPRLQEWGGTSACVADPDGFRWDFTHNPGFEVDGDGTVHLRVL